MTTARWKTKNQGNISRCYPKNASHEAGLLISVIVVVFNGSKTLQRCIDSVAKQSFPNKELIVIDGGSSDGTVELVRQNHSRIAYWVSEPDHGIYNAWNKGLAQAHGEWICFLGADDWFCDSEVLARVAALLERVDSTHDIVYGQVRMVNAAGGEVDKLGAPWEQVRGSFNEGTYCLPTPAIFHRRSAFAKYGHFDEGFRIAGDYELQLRVLRSGNPLFLERLMVSNMQQGGISSRPESAVISLREMARAKQQNNLPGWTVGLSIAYAKARLRSIMWKLLGRRLTCLLLDAGRKMTGKAPYWTKI